MSAFDYASAELFTVVYLGDNSDGTPGAYTHVPIVQLADTLAENAGSRIAINEQDLAESLAERIAERLERCHEASYAQTQNY